MPAIAPINRILAPQAAPPVAAPGHGERFRAVFADAVAKVEEFQQNAQASIGRFLAGEGEEVHQVALEAQQAELAFALFLEVRNKVIAAYEEVMRMQV